MIEMNKMTHSQHGCSLFVTLCLLTLTYGQAPLGSYQQALGAEGEGRKPDIPSRQMSNTSVTPDRGSVYSISDSTTQQPRTTSAVPRYMENRLNPPATYMITVPRKVRPDMVVQLSISILAMPYEHFVVTATINKDKEEYATLMEVFTEPTSRLSAMRMPPGAQSGNYTLTLRGYTSVQMLGVIFQNETDLEFQQKHVSVYITTDQWVYQKRSIVNFRVYAWLPNMIPVPSGSVDIFVRDGAGQVTRRWLFQQLRNGYLERVMPTYHPAKHGWWTIEVHGWGEVYKYNFKTENHFPTLYDINITMPDAIYEDDYGLAGTVIVNMTESGIPIHGNATVQLEIRPPGVTDEEEYLWITRYIKMFTGVIHFMFSMEEIEELNPELAGTELVVHAAIMDWYGLEYKDDGVAYCYVQKRGYKIEFLGGSIRTFKPGALLPAYIAVFSEDGKKFDKKLYNTVHITTTIRKITGGTTVLEEEGYLIPDDSIVRYTYLTELDDKTIEITAAYGGDKPNQQYLIATRHYTESNHYLYISTSTREVKLDNYIVFTVRCTAFLPELRYVVSSKGNIITAATLFMYSRQKTFALAASRDMLPESTIVVYGVLNTGEIIADSTTFHVQGIRSDGVDVVINYGKDFTKDTVEFIGKTDASTYIAYQVEDYEFVQRGINPFLTQYKVEEDLLEYSADTNTSFKHTWYYDEGIMENVFFNAPCSAIDANETFVYAGLIVFTDGNLGRIIGSDHCNYTLHELPCFEEGACYTFDQKCDGIWQCNDGADEMGCPQPSELNRRDYRGDIYRIWDHMDDRKWAWTGHYTMPNGRLELPIDVPIRPTTWLVQGIALGTDNGLAFNEHPARLYSVRPFFIFVEVPKACFKGEQLGIQVAVFNFCEQPLETILMLADSDDYRFIVGEEYGIVSSYNPRTTRGDIQTMVYLYPGEQRFIHFPILPVVTSKFSVTITALSKVRNQQVTKEVTVSFDGVTNYFHTPFLVDLVNSGSVYIPHLYIPVPERFVDPEERQHLYVPGSGKCSVSLSGDVVGPGFTADYLEAPMAFNKMVHGDGQHYLFEIGLNMYWLKFLDQVNELERDTLEKALAWMNKLLNPIYAYILDGGGMAMRRSRSPMSVWLTSIALDILSKCSYQEWEYILYIDIPLLNKMVIWMAQQQDKTTGAFQETSMDFDHKMRSNLTNEYGQPLNMTLTAYAIIGLESASQKVNGEATSIAAEARDMAADYIARNFHLLWSPFDICVCTYALFLTNHASRAGAFSKMRSIARTENYMYWAEEEIPPQETVIIDNIPYRYANYLPYGHHSKAIHGTALALEVYLINNLVQESIPIMKWLQEQRFYEHSFDGTTDTLAAVQALAKFGERQTNREFYNMAVNVIATSTSDWFQDFTLERGQVHGYETQSIPNVWGSVYSTAQGTGYALLQMKTQVNVEYPHLMRQPQIRAFDLDIDYFRFSGKNASLFEMNVCITWVATQYGDRSGSVILEVDIPTGWFVRKQQLRVYQRVGRIDSQRSRFAKQKVVLYIDYIDTNRTCWFFPAERHLPVANGTIQHFIRVQDSYEHAFHNTTLYTTYELFHNHICQVCGSFQCPYCMHYNGCQSLLAACSTWSVFIMLAVCFISLELSSYTPRYKERWKG